MTPLLEATGLVKRYGPLTVVAGVDLEVVAGEVVGLLGPNGAGKSTLLRMCLGLTPPSSGAVRLQGRPLGLASAGTATSACFDTPSFVPYLSARENLRLFARYAGVETGAHPGSPVDRELSAAGLEPAAWDRRVAKLSHGMRQRLGLAVALVGDPSLVVLDEPHNGLDPLGVETVRDLVRERAARGAGVVLSSHAIAEVQGLCDRIVVMAGGRVVLSGRPRDLVASDSFLLDAAPAGRARSVLAQLGLAPRRIPGSDALVVPGDGAARVRAVRQLCLADVDVREVRPLQEDLVAVVRRAVEASAVPAGDDRRAWAPVPSRAA